MYTVLPTKTINDHEQYIEIDDNFSRYECIVFFFCILVITTFFIIAAWSGILLISGRIEGGGPLGMLMNALLL
jgi:hypothetical protein